MNDDRKRTPSREHEAERIPIRERIRSLRQKSGMTGYELARRAGISPSYISLIEKGEKVPDEEVAVAIARALGDDASLYRAWALTRRGDLSGTRRALETAERFSTDPALRDRLRRGEDVAIDEVRSRPLAAPVASPLQSTVGEFEVSELSAEYADAELSQLSRCRDTELETPQLRFALASPLEPAILEIPVLAEGADPGRGEPPPSLAVGRFRIDAAGIAEDDRPGLFAYKVTAHSARRLRGVVEPGTFVAISRRFRPPSPERIHAVRHHDAVVLSRALWKGSSLLLLPAEGASDFEYVEVGDAARLREVLVGSVVLAVRRWE
jgi:transcriptional regulator with XRE-family HTH domain